MIDLLTQTQEKINVLSDIVCTAFIEPDIEPFIARDHFIIGDKPSGELKIAFLSQDFRNLFVPKVEGPFMGKNLCGYKIVSNAIVASKLSNFNNPQSIVITLREAFIMLRRQWDGGEGDLLVDGRANIFYIRDINSEVRPVFAFWTVQGWVFYTIAIIYPIAWYVGHRIFSNYFASPKIIRNNQAII